MKDMNIAKMTSVDLPLINGIMSDLFPGIETPVADYSKVETEKTYLRLEKKSFKLSHGQKQRNV